MADKRFKQPTRVVVVNDDGTAAVATMRDAGTTQPAATPKPLATTRADADIVESVPKSLKSKADRLLKRPKKRPDYTVERNRGEWILEGATIPGSNMMDLVHDVLKKRKQSDPVGWQPFVKHLKDVNILMELVGNADRRQYIRRCVVVGGPHQQWQADFVDVSKLKNIMTGSYRYRCVF